MRLASSVLVILVLVSALFAQTPGERLYTSNCANCHGTDGSRNTAYAHKVATPDLRGAAIQGMTDQQLAASIGRGEGHKVYPHAFAMRGMSKMDIDAIVAHVRTFKK